MIDKPLSEIQEPIKKELVEHPERAVVSLSAAAVLSGRFKWDVKEENLEFTAGLPSSAGGKDDAASPGIVFLSSLAVCAGITLSAVADNMGIMLHSCRTVATGILDQRGTLAVSEQAPVGFTGIDIKFELDSDADDKQLEDLLEATAKYSVNCRTVSDGMLITYDIVET